MGKAKKSLKLFKFSADRTKDLYITWIEHDYKDLKSLSLTSNTELGEPQTGMVEVPSSIPTGDS